MGRVCQRSVTSVTDAPPSRCRGAADADHKHHTQRRDASCARPLCPSGLSQQSNTMTVLHWLVTPGKFPSPTNEAPQQPEWKTLKKWLKWLQGVGETDGRREEKEKEWEGKDSQGHQRERGRERLKSPGLITC